MGAKIIVQARMGSSRLPGKVLAALGEATLLDSVFDRCSLSRRSGGLLLATTDLPEDDALAAWAEAKGVPVFRGSGTDVLERYAGAAAMADADPVVRITGDCPLIDPDLLDAVLELYGSRPCDYATHAGYPRGLDVEVVSRAALLDALQRTTATETYYREHVTTYIAENPARYRAALESAPGGLDGSAYRVCVDEPADLELVREVCRHFHPRRDFRYPELLAYLRTHPEVASLNSHVRQKAV